MRYGKYAAALLLANCWSPTQAQNVDFAFAGSYSMINLSPISGVPPNYGAMTFKDANTLWVSGQATNASGLFYSVPVTRGSDKHIVSFGSATAFGFGAFNDGGIDFAPNGAVLYTQFPVNNIAESLPPAYSSDYKTIPLSSLGVATSVGALAFVPAGFNGAGQFKVVSHDTDDFYTIPLTADGGGGYNTGGQAHFHA
jgi:hypothetical protein